MNWPRKLADDPVNQPVPRRLSRSHSPLPLPPRCRQPLPRLPAEETLITAAAAGDPIACREIFECFRGRVFSLAAFTLEDPDQAEDVLQSVFMNVFRSLPAFRFESSLGTWIYRITINQCHDYRRSRPHRLLSLEELRKSSSEPGTGHSADDFHARSESGAPLYRALRGLSAKLRTVIVLRYLEGLTYEEIAAVLSCSTGTVASRISRALLALQTQMQSSRKELP